MKLKIPYRIATIVAFGAILYACNKSNSNSNSSSGLTNSDLQVQSDDQSRISTETDAVANDVNTTLSSPGASGATGAGYSQGIQTSGANPITSLICDATITLDTTTSANRTITITYNGTNCLGTRTRKGTVIVTIPAGVHWGTAGAQITVSIQNLAITRLRDNKTITLNGTHIYTNVSGGRLIDLISNPGSITHTITADSMKITFDDGTQRYWSVARQRVYTYAGGFVETTTGMHTDGTNTNISEWGTTRYGNSFETLITSPLIIDESCSWRLTSGSIEILRPNITAGITYGLDSTGAATSCPGAGNYYLKAVWQGPNGGSGSAILPY